MPDEMPYRPDQAFIFGEAYIRAGWTVKDVCGVRAPEPVIYVIAANMALGLELYLKCLLLLEGQVPAEKHNLKLHFDALSKESRTEIRREYARILKADAHMKSEKKRVKERGQNPDKIFRFDRVLDEAALAFEKSRYPFDPQYKKHSYLAVPIAEATKKRIIRIKPEFGAVAEMILGPIGAPPTSLGR
jgi:hypothetical protein